MRLVLFYLHETNNRVSKDSANVCKTTLGNDKLWSLNTGER